MTCPGCLIALAGFGDDTPPSPPPVTDISQLPPQAQQTVRGLGEGLWIMILSPIIGSVVSATAGAIAWKGHRVLGGLLGFFLGGAAGGVAGFYLGKAHIRAALPTEQQLDDMGKSLQRQIQDAMQQSGNPTAPMRVGPLMVDPATFGAPAAGTAPRPSLSMLSPLRLLSPSTAASSTSSTATRTVLPTTTSPSLVPATTSTQSRVQLPCPSGTTLINGQCLTAEKRVVLPTAPVSPTSQATIPSIADAVSQQSAPPAPSSGGGFSFSMKL